MSFIDATQMGWGASIFLLLDQVFKMQKNPKCKNISLKPSLLML
uniref:Uncharacterized protein n=1 Tax=viral metagenome TaxID=1070528 RepID=A0A6C0I546_9ZZZZ